MAVDGGGRVDGRKNIDQERRGDVRAKKAGIRRAVRPPHPDADAVAVVDADRPGVAETEAGAGFPGDAAARRNARLDVPPDRPAGFQQVADDEGGPGAQQAALLQGLANPIAGLGGKAALRQGAISADQVFQTGGGAAQDDRKIGFRALGQIEFEAAGAQRGGEILRPQMVEHLDRRHVERLAQGFGDAHRAGKIRLKISRLVAVEGLRHVGEQRFRVDQAGVERHAVEEGFQRRAGRTPRLHHVHVGKTGVVGKIGRAGVGADFHAAVVHHQCGQGNARRQQRQAAGEQLLDQALRRHVQRALDAR